MSYLFSHNKEVHLDTVHLNHTESLTHPHCNIDTLSQITSVQWLASSNLTRVQHSTTSFDGKEKKATHLLTKTNSWPSIEGNKDERVLGVVLRYAT